MTDDAELLRRYARNSTNESFAEIVQRHIDFVYAAAVRQTNGNAALAQDVTQRVFVDLARKAATLAHHNTLVGWLHTATRFAAAKAVRSEARRQLHERNAAAWHDADPAVDWAQLQPVIDEALGELKERERTAILLRFFEGRHLADVGERLALSEGGARSCLERALEKLRGHLARRGIRSTGAALGLALGQQPTIGAPAGLLATVVSGATHSAEGGAGLLAMFLAMSKIKLGITAAVVAAIVVPTALELHANRALIAELETLRATSGNLPALRRENEKQTVTLRTVAAEYPDAAELLRLRARLAQLQQRPDGVVDAEIKPQNAWRNSGWATPEAALETVMWAGATGNSEELVRRSAWIGDARRKADAAFAQLSETIRARYGTPDRLFGEFCFGSRGPENDAAMQKNYADGGSVVAFQILDTAPDYKRDGMRVRHWEELSNGTGRERSNTFARLSDGYGFGESRWSDEGWQNIIAQIDSATGAFRPRKIVPMDPVTGRPKQ